MRFLAFTASALLLHCVAVAQWSLDLQGWTIVTTQPDEVIYVSSSLGDDIAYNGLSPVPDPIDPGRGPKRTIAAGYAMLDDGDPDWLLLKEGDTWLFAGGVMAVPNWTKSGRSVAEPMILGSYSTGPMLPRPKIVSEADAFYSNNFQGGVHGSGLHYLMITGIHFEHLLPPQDPPFPDPTGILVINGPNQWLRIEGCYINGWWKGIAFNRISATASNISIRRCVVVDNYDPYRVGGDQMSGLYVQGTNGLLVEECLFDRNGWDGVDPDTRNTQNHNIYIQVDCTGVTLIGNISARGSADNFQVRSVGTIDKNLSLKTPIHFSLRGVGPDGLIRGNVALEGDDINLGALRGWGYEVKNVAGPAASMRYNIVAHKNPPGSVPTAGGDPRSIVLDGGTGMTNFVVNNNIVWDWGAPLELLGTAMTNVVLHSNDVQEPVRMTHAFVGPDTHAVTGWVSHSNRFWTQKSSETFMRWVGTDYIVNDPSPMGTNGWRQQILVQGGIVDGPPDSKAHEVMNPTHLPHVPYPTPSQTITTYHQSPVPAPAGTGGLDEFLLECRQQRKGNWRVKFTGLEAVRYFQDGFGMPIPLP